jgi:hypothetical protein
MTPILWHVTRDLRRANCVKVGDWSIAPSFVFCELARFLIAWVGDSQSLCIEWKIALLFVLNKLQRLLGFGLVHLYRVETAVLGGRPGMSGGDWRLLRCG